MTTRDVSLCCPHCGWAAWVPADTFAAGWRLREALAAHLVACEDAHRARPDHLVIDLRDEAVRVKRT